MVESSPCYAGLMWRKCLIYKLHAFCCYKQWMMLNSNLRSEEGPRHAHIGHSFSSPFIFKHPFLLPQHSFKLELVYSYFILLRQCTDVHFVVSIIYVIDFVPQLAFITIIAYSRKSQKRDKESSLYWVSFIMSILIFRNLNMQKAKPHGTLVQLLFF